MEVRRTGIAEVVRPRQRAERNVIVFIGQREIVGHVRTEHQRRFLLIRAEARCDAAHGSGQILSRFAVRPVDAREVRLLTAPAARHQKVVADRFRVRRRQIVSRRVGLRGQVNGYAAFRGKRRRCVRHHERKAQHQRGQRLFLRWQGYFPPLTKKACRRTPSD